MPEIAFVDYPPDEPNGTGFARLVWPPAKGTLYCRLLGRWRGVVTHWLSEKHSPTGKPHSVPCQASAGICAHCEAGNPGRWYGYLPVQVWSGRRDGTEHWEPAILVLPQAAIRPLLDLPTLRGQLIRVERAGGRTSAVTLTVLSQQAEAPPMPPCIDVEAVLRKVWGATMKPAAPAAAEGEPDGGEDDEVQASREDERRAEWGSRGEEDLTDGL